MACNGTDNSPAYVEDLSWVQPAGLATYEVGTDPAPCWDSCVVHDLVAHLVGRPDVVALVHPYLVVPVHVVAHSAAVAALDESFVDFRIALKPAYLDK